MKAYGTSMGVEVELECLKGQVCQTRQLVFVEASGKTHHLPIRDDLRDPEELRTAYLGLDVTTQPADVRLVCDPEESVWLEPLIKAAWPSVSFGERRLGAKNYEKGVAVKLQLTDRYFRAIAKIGFHYFLTQFPVFDGREPCFSDLRRFIIEDGGDVTRANTFIGERTNPLLGAMMGGARPDGWIAHVLSAEIQPEACLAHVQLFVCKDYRSPVHTVHLAQNGNDAAIDANGHIYIYFEEGPRGKFSGEAHALDVTRMATAPPPLKPVVGNVSTRQS